MQDACTPVMNGTGDCANGHHMHVPTPIDARLSSPANTPTNEVATSAHRCLSIDDEVPTSSANSDEWILLDSGAMQFYLAKSKGAATECKPTRKPVSTVSICRKIFKHSTLVCIPTNDQDYQRQISHFAPTLLHTMSGG
jgi:hypothetical protein